MSSNDPIAPKRSEADRIIRSSIAGGIAGGVAKTAIAPLDRVKILYQTQHSEYVLFARGSWKGAAGALSHIVNTQGVLGLYRGHSLTLARAIPHAAVGYTVYEYVRPVLMPTKADETSFRRMLAGSLAGVSVLPFTYPFELVRVRMALETKQSSGGAARPKLSTAFLSIYREPPAPYPSYISPRFVPPILHFYRGFSVSVIGTVPYRGGIFLVWESLLSYAQTNLSRETYQTNRNTIHLAVGAIAGTSAQIVTYPLEVIRRMQQASGLGFVGAREVVGNIWVKSGWRGFYAGLGIGLVKQVPMHAISLSVWQASKKFLGV